MNNQIRNIFNSIASEVSILAIICCLISMSLSIEFYGKWNTISVVSTIIGALVLLWLLVWATVMLFSKKEVKEMPTKPRLIVETIGRLLFLYWLYITVGLIVAIIWGVLILWDGIRSIKEMA